MLPQRKFQRLLYNFYSYFAIFIGATSYRYDFKRHQYYNTGYSRFVACLANIWALVFMPSEIYEAWSSNFKLDMVTELTVIIDTTINGVACLLRVLQRLPRERETRALFRKLERFQRIYRYRRSNRHQQMEIKLEQIYLAKNIFMWLLAIILTAFLCISYNAIACLKRISFFEQLMLVFYAFVLDGQDITMHLHFLITWRICQLYTRLNNRVKNLINDSSGKAATTLELQHLRWQHCQLAKLLKRLNVSYSFVMISSRLSLIVSAAALGYYISVFRAKNFPIICQILGFGLYVVIAIECYMLDLIYDLTMNAYRETSLMLRAHNELCIGTKQLDRGCELFALQIASFPLKFEPYGLFNSGRATWLSNLACIFSWIIVLLQYRIVSQKTV